MHTEHTDKEIIKKVLSGDKNAFAALVEQYQNFVFTIILGYVKNREDAEEVAQDVFIKAYKFLADFKGNSKFSTWLYTICTTTSITFLRKKKVDVQSLHNEKVFDQASIIVDGKAVNIIEQKSKVAMVNNALTLLNKDDVLIIQLFYKGEQTLEEIGQILGLETNTVKVRLHRARTRLKEKMQQHFSAEIEDIY